MKLTEKELLEATALIEKMRPGLRYELEDIYLGHWGDVESPTTFGKRFKNSVLLGEIFGLEFIEKDSNNHSIYKRV